MSCTPPDERPAYPQSSSAEQPAPPAREERHEPAKAPPSPSRATAVAERARPAPSRVDTMPLWKVLLHNDDVNDEVHVVRALIELAAMRTQQAVHVMLEAHNAGIALVCAAHRERAELYQEQFASKGLTVTIEPDR